MLQILHIAKILYVIFFAARIKVASGGCFPTLACSSDCNQLFSSTQSSTLPFPMELEQCNLTCCDTNLCNDIGNDEQNVLPGKLVVITFFLYL